MYRCTSVHVYVINYVHSVCDITRMRVHTFRIHACLCAWEYEYCGNGRLHECSISAAPEKTKPISVVTPSATTRIMAPLPKKRHSGKYHHTFQQFFLI